MSRGDVSGPVSKQLGYVLKRAQHSLRTRLDEALRPLGLTAPQYAVLSAVESEPGLSNAQLARAAFVTPQTMQGILANLERQGLLTRAADPTHGRILRSGLTRSGRETLVEAHRRSAKVEALMVAAVGADAAGRLASELARCADALTARGEQSANGE